MTLRNLAPFGIVYQPNDPTYKPMRIPTGGAFDEEVILVAANKEWLRRVADVMNALDQPDVWGGTETDVEDARAEVRKLLVAMVDGMTIIQDVRISGDDHIEYTTDGQNWTPIEPRVVTQRSTDTQKRIWGDTNGDLRVQYSNGYHLIGNPNSILEGALYLRDKFSTPLIRIQRRTSDGVSVNTLGLQTSFSGGSLASSYGSLNHLVSHSSSGSSDLITWGRIGTTPLLGFYGGNPVAKPIVSGDFDNTGGMGSLLSALESLGLITLAGVTFSQRLKPADMPAASEIVTDVTFDACVGTVWRYENTIFRTWSIQDCIDAAMPWELEYNFAISPGDLGFWTVFSGGIANLGYGTTWYADEQLITDVEGEMLARLQWTNSYKFTYVEVTYGFDDVTPAPIDSEGRITIGNPQDDTAAVTPVPPDPSGIFIWEPTGDYELSNAVSAGIDYTYAENDDSPIGRIFRVLIKGVGAKPPKDPDEE